MLFSLAMLPVLLSAEETKQGLIADALEEEVLAKDALAMPISEEELKEEALADAQIRKHILEEGFEKDIAYEEKAPLSVEPEAPPAALPKAKKKAHSKSSRPRATNKR